MLSMIESLVFHFHFFHSEMLESKDGKTIEDGSEDLMNAGTDLQFKCSICLKKYFTREDLGTHMKTSHLEKLVCEFCDTSLSDKKQLSKHISNIHGAKNIIYKCEVCNLEFKLKPTFEMHMICLNCGYDLSKYLNRTGPL